MSDTKWIPLSDRESFRLEKALTSRAQTEHPLTMNQRLHMFAVLCIGERPIRTEAA